MRSILSDFFSSAMHLSTCLWDTSSISDNALADNLPSSFNSNRIFSCKGCFFDFIPTFSSSAALISFPLLIDWKAPLMCIALLCSSFFPPRSRFLRNSSRNSVVSCMPFLQKHESAKASIQIPPGDVLSHP